MRFIRCYGDSVALPRVKEGQNLEDTYPLLVADVLEAGVWVRSQPNGTVIDARGQVEVDGGYLGPRESDVIVVQVGVVDCAPRPLPPRVRAGVGRLPGPFRALIISGIRRNRQFLTKGAAHQVVPLARFEIELGILAADASIASALTVLLTIAPPNRWFSDRSPALREQIDAYNTAIRAIAKTAPRTEVLDVHDLFAGEEERLMTSDGHHFTRDAHAMVAEALVELIRSADEQR